MLCCKEGNTTLRAVLSIKAIEEAKIEEAMIQLPGALFNDTKDIQDKLGKGERKT